MKELYNEMMDRLYYLRSQEQTEEVTIRINELTLSIVRVQQILLENIKNK